MEDDYDRAGPLGLDWQIQKCVSHNLFDNVVVHCKINHDKDDLPTAQAGVLACDFVARTPLRAARTKQKLLSKQILQCTIALSNIF